MNKKELGEGMEYYYVTGIFIADCYVTQKEPYLVINIEGEGLKLEPNPDKLFKNFEDAQEYILKDLNKTIKMVENFKNYIN